MRTADISQLDDQITSLEQQLAGLYEQKVNLLNQEIDASQQRADALSGGSSQPARRTAARDAPAKVATKAARKAASKKAAKPGQPAKAKKKRLRMSTEEVEKRLIDVVKAAGKEGLSLKVISDTSGIKYPTAAKKLKEMSSVFGKRGELKDSRYFIKPDAAV